MGNPEMDTRAPKPLKKKREVEATGKDLNSGKSKHDVKKTALMAEIRKQASLKTKRKKKRLEQKPATKNALMQAIREKTTKLRNVPKLTKTPEKQPVAVDSGAVNADFYKNNMIGMTDADR